MDGMDPSATRASVTSSPSNSYDSFRYEDSSTSTTQTSTSCEISSANPNIHDYSDISSANPNIYAYSEIRAATKNFLLKPLSSSNDAWRCSMRKKDVVVIRRRLRRSVEMSEMVNRLSTICESSHFSIIKLLGASISDDLIFLVYDYVSGVNLADWLRKAENPNHAGNSNRTLLKPWILRMQIATQIAHGLEHIHHYMESEMRIVHNHLNSTSVILTEPYFSTKICHFGTAELCGEISIDQIEESEIEERRCYIAPELIAGGIVSQKSDVFAFGVLLLEILSGEEPVKEIYDDEISDYRKISLIDSARNAIESGEIEQIRQWIDHKLRVSYPDELAEKMMRVGLDCVHVDPNKRPDLRHLSTKIWKLFLEGTSMEPVLVKGGIRPS